MRWYAALDSNHVFAGADNGAVMVMRFLRPTVVVHVGDTVTFDNNGMGAPHTVTFGEEPPPRRCSLPRVTRRATRAAT